jgi:LysR family transcriptional regulator AphB
VPRFLERFPDVALRLVTAEDADVAEGFDVELRSDGRCGPTEVASPLGSPPMLLCAAPAYLAGKTLPRTPSDLGAHALLWSTAEPSPALRLSKDGGTVSISCAPRLASADPAALHAAVAAGLGIGVLPEFLCRNGLAMRRLVRVLPDWDVADKVTLHAVCPADRANDPSVRAFIDFLAANIVPALAGAAA